LTFRKILLFLPFAVLLGVQSARAQQPVVVFAAASLKTALDEIATQYQAQSTHSIRISYAGSSALARQIQYGAPAELFISANSAWMDTLAQDGLIEDASRVDLLRNRLALVGPQTTPEPFDISTDLKTTLGTERLALALVDAVPAGIYAKAALQSLGMWDPLQTQIAQTDNVRAALRLVAIGEAPLGIVYDTDHRAEDHVKALYLFPENSHPPILYPAALISDQTTEAGRAFLDYLQDSDSTAIFQAHGFITMGNAP